MVKKIKRKDGEYFRCQECGLLYNDEMWALKCQEWCLRHKSCNLDIIKHAVKDKNH